MDNYELITKIGSGACGSVYLVRSHSNGRQYALKKVQLDETRKTRTREALLKEVRILAELKHPHIVGYHDSFFANDADANFIHIVQDYCDGGTLDEKIIQKRKEGGYLQESTIMEWYIQIAMAIQYMHARKILHRDIKPQNVFMTKSDGVKLGDFGIAKVLDNTLDAAVTCVGTPCYLSPELCQDIPYSSKSDIWASGCVLFEICALKPAFDAQNLISLFYKITNANYQNLPEHFSPELKQFVASILVKEPALRPSASSILNLPYIRNYLEIFIKDREYLLKQKIISLKSKTDGGSALSPKLRTKNNQTNQAVRHSTPMLESKLLQELPTLRKSLDPNTLTQRDKGEGQRESLSPKYSDDFDSSSSEDEQIPEEDIPDETPDESEYKEDQPITEGRNINGPLKSEEDDSIEATLYDDDFEDDSEAEELDEIINNAREAHSVSPADEFFFDENHTPNKQSSIRQYLESHVVSSDCTENLKSKFQVKHKTDGVLTETCYLMDDEDTTTT